MIDLQVNGGAGVDCSRCGVDEYDVLGRYLAGTGVTAYLPTIISAPLEEMRRAAEAAADARARHSTLPEIIGVHLEGPYLNPLRRGAHRAQDLRHPSVPEISETLRRAHGTVRVVTLAPELEGSEPMVRALASQGIVVALGHTDATYDEVREAVQWGARLVTHVFNAMRGLHHREPGAAGAALLTRGLVVSVIADGLHVHPAVLGLIARTAGANRVALITDAVSGAGQLHVRRPADRGARRRSAASRRHACGERTQDEPGGSDVRRGRRDRAPGGGPVGNGGAGALVGPRAEGPGG
jgi:N-acetylglucosamine-6-phosphate deacetylase